MDHLELVEEHQMQFHERSSVGLLARESAFAICVGLFTLYSLSRLIRSFILAFRLLWIYTCSSFFVCSGFTLDTRTFLRPHSFCIIYLSVDSLVRRVGAIPAEVTSFLDWRFI